MRHTIRRALLAASVTAAAIATSVPAAAAVPQFGEKEPATAAGQNDDRGSAQWLPRFGTGDGETHDAVVRGTLSPAPAALATGAEDDGAIPLATTTGIGTDGRGAVTATGRLGDGPHGALGDRTNDFDFYRLTGSAGHTLTVSTAGSSGATDTVVAVYDAAGALLASDDNGAGGLHSRLGLSLPADGDYYVVVAGQSAAGSLPADPNDSGSGLGGADDGDYRVLIASAPVDQDHYAVRLRAGDVLGANLDLAGARLTVHRPSGVEAVGSTADRSTRYPQASPLPGGGAAALAYVADRSGWHTVSVSGGFGPYALTLAARRPGPETWTAEQTIFLDFDGGQIDTAPLGGPGVRQLSGLSAFLAGWGLSAADESAVIGKATAVVTENVRSDLAARGTNPDVAVRIRNSRDHADPFGGANVSRVVVGGRTSESGIGPVAVAESVDPGNFAADETALVQLDRLSAATGPLSLNRYLAAGSDRIAFVGQALGNLVSREIGHLVGNFDTDPGNAAANLMDADGNFSQLFGVGPDGVGGTADDPDVDFGKDAYAPALRFTGVQDTLNVAAWGLSKPCD